MKVAVVGGGVAGVTAAHILQRAHAVTLFEGNDYVGGHTHTVVVPDGPDSGTPVDTGFIVLNDRTYPLLRTFLAQLEVETRPADMSFSFQGEDTGLQYAGTDMNGLFAQRRNVFRPSFWRMLKELIRFCRESKKLLTQDCLPRMDLAEYLERGRYRREMVEQYLKPIAASIWSTPPGDVTLFPAEALLRFFDNHGLLSLVHRPQWMTVAGGSHTYVKSFLQRFRGRVWTNARVVRVRRTEGRVVVKPEDGEEQSFDRVVLAAHADESLAMLEDPSDVEAALLGAWKYQENRVTLHTDASVLPASRRAWACWNYRRRKTAGGDEAGVVTYYMNRLQGLHAESDFCVTLNRPEPYAEGTVIREMEYAHPLYTFESMDTQKELPTLNGQRNTYFCGSYFGYGFHEDAVRAAVAVGQAFGLEL